MKKQSLFFALLVLLSTTYSCNKDDKDVTTTKGSSNETNDNSEKITGDLSAAYTFIDTTFPNNTTIVRMQTAEARFIKSIKESVLTLADTVMINGHDLQKLSANYHSLSTNDIANLNLGDSCLWKVGDTSSHGAIPTFTYNFTAPYPSLLGKLPDTVTKLNGFKVNIQIAGADSVIMAISGDTTNSEGYISKYFNPAINNYYFAPSDITKIRTSDKISARQSFVIVAYTSTIRKYGDKYIRFLKQYAYYGGIWVKQE